MGTVAAVIFTDASDGLRRETAAPGWVTVAGLSVAERAARTFDPAGYLGPRLRSSCDAGQIAREALKRLPDDVERARDLVASNASVGLRGGANAETS